MLWALAINVVMVLLAMSAAIITNFFALFAEADTSCPTCWRSASVSARRKSRPGRRADAERSGSGAWNSRRAGERSRACCGSRSWSQSRRSAGSPRRPMSRGEASSLLGSWSCSGTPSRPGFCQRRSHRRQSRRGFAAFVCRRARRIRRGRGGSRDHPHRLGDPRPDRRSGDIGVILISSWRLIREPVEVLLERAPEGLDVAEVGQAIAAVTRRARGPRSAHLVRSRPAFQRWRRTSP